MKKNIILAAFGAALLTACLLSCTSNKNTNGEDPNDSTKTGLHSTDSIEGEADDTEMQGLTPYEEETFSIDKLPKTAVLQAKSGNYELYVNVEQEPDEDDLAGTYSVWVADKSVKTVRRVLLTNPTAGAVWEEMTAKNAGVEVPIHLVAAADKALFASKDCKKILVEGCPDARNIWTYIIDLDKHTAMQLPGTEGVQNIDLDKGEVILASYGYYEEGGRYTYQKAYSLDGKFLRQTSDPEPE